MNTVTALTALTVAPIREGFFHSPIWRIILTVVLVLILLYILGIVSYSIYKNRKLLDTPDNQARIRNERLSELNAYSGAFQMKPSFDSSMSATNVPQNQKLLINTAVQGVRLTGYLGPYSYGMFDVDNGVRLALTTGARCLVLEIDYNEDTSEPRLIYLAQGIKYSLNEGSLLAASKSIAARAFASDGDGSPDTLRNDPLIVVTYLLNAPSETRDYLKYLGKIAQQLQPLTPHLLGQTSQGDFRRQTLESQLFFQPPSIFSRKIIHLCNADTSMLRNLSAYNIQGQIGPDQDLDLMVHARLYAKESPCPLGITSTPTESKTAAAVLTTPTYWLTIPPERKQQAVNDTKRAWTLVLEPNPDQDTMTSENLLNIHKEYGIHCMPFSLADVKPKQDKWIGQKQGSGSSSGLFARIAWRVKEAPLRFVPPEPIPIKIPSPQTDAGQGRIPSPSL